MVSVQGIMGSGAAYAITNCGRLGRFVCSRLFSFKAMKVAVITAVALSAMANIQGADAGFALCMPPCLAATGGSFAPACTAACVALCATNPV